MARGQDDLRGFEAEAAFADHLPGALCAFHRMQVRDAGAEVVFAAVVHDALTDVLHDQRQAVAADVRMGVHQNRRIGAEGHQLVQHFADVAPFVGARKEFAVREGTGAAFAEAVVRIGVDAAGRREGGDISFAGVDIHTALQNHRFTALH